MKSMFYLTALVLLVPHICAAPASAQKPGSPGLRSETPQQKEKRLAWLERRAEIRKERKREKCLANPAKRGCDKILAGPPAELEGVPARPQ